MTSKTMDYWGGLFGSCLRKFETSPTCRRFNCYRARTNIKSEAIENERNSRVDSCLMRRKGAPDWTDPSGSHSLCQASCRQWRPGWWANQL